MKIVYCTGSLYNMGGAERVLIDKANYLSELPNIKVYIITAAQKNKQFCQNLNPKVIHYDADILQFFPKRIIPLLTARLTFPKIKAHYQDIINAILPDVIIVNELGYDDRIIPALKTKAKTIREFHSSHKAVMQMILKSSGLQRLSVKKVNKQSMEQFNKFDALVLLSLKDKSFRDYKTYTEVIPNMIVKMPEIKSSLKNKRVISVGRLDELKNFKDQILVWSKINKKFPDWTLHIYGEGAQKNNLQQLINTLKLNNVVFLEGRNNEITQEYVKSSIFLFTSLAEGFGMVLIEAMAAGLPCVSYNTPCGPSEIIDDGVNGYLTDLTDLDVFEDRVSQLINSEELRLSLGRAAVLTAETFLPIHIMPKWLSLFDGLLSERYD